MDPLLGEVATAAIGIDSILRGKASYGLGKEGIAGSLPTNLARLVGAYIRRTEPAPLSELPEFDYQDVSALLANAGKPEQGQRLQEAIGDPELGGAVEETATRIIETLQQALPARTVETLTGSVPVPPSAQELAKFRRAWQVAVDPLVVLRDLNEDAMSLDQVQALEAMYPTLYALIKPAVVKTVADEKAKRPSWEPGYRKESRLRVLLQLPRAESLMSDVQALYAQSKAEAPAAAKKAVGLDAQKVATPAQANEIA